MVKVEHENFSVKQIARSGQCFRLNEIETGVFEVIAYGKRLHIIQEKDNGPVALCCSRQEYETLWKRYFDLETNYRYYIIFFPGRCRQGAEYGYCGRNCGKQW